MILYVYIDMVLFPGLYDSNLSCTDYFIWLECAHYLFRTFSWSFWLHIQVVTGASLCTVAKKVIHHVRFPLLDPEHLSRVEKENEKTMMIPVSVIYKFHTMYLLWITCLEKAMFFSVSYAQVSHIQKQACSIYDQAFTATLFQCESKLSSSVSSVLTMHCWWRLKRWLLIIKCVTTSHTG